MLASPTPLFLTGFWCCSAHNSCTVETQGVLPADRRQGCYSCPPSRAVYQRCSRKVLTPGYPPRSFRRSYTWRCLSVLKVRSVSDLFLSFKLLIQPQNIHISINSLCLIWKRHPSTSARKAAEMRTLLLTRNNQHVKHLSALAKQAHMERSHDRKQPFKAWQARASRNSRQLTLHT